MGQVERWIKHRSSDEPGTGRAVVLVLAGVAIGAGLALLLTTKSGPELRAAIVRGYRKTVEGVSGSANDLRERAQGVPNLLRFGRRPRRAGINSGA